MDIPETDDPGPSTTIFDLQPDLEAKVDVRRLPRMTAEGVRLLLSAGRADFVLSTALQAVGGLGLAIELVVGQRALAALFKTVRTGGSLWSLVPWALAVAAISLAVFYASAVQRERQRILGEMVTRHVEQRLLDVTTAVPLLAFDTPSFHNRLQRVRSNAHQPLNLAFGVSGLAGAAVGTLGVVVGLAAIEPILIPLIAVVFLPAWLVASRRSEAFYRLFWRLTPRDRERQYLAGTLAGRDQAKEVRAFGLAGHLRSRYERLYDERIAELRDVSRRQLAYSLAASLAIGGVVTATLLLIAWFTLVGRITLPEAAVAVAGVAVVGARLTSAGYAAGALSEAGLYLDDYRVFLGLLSGASAEGHTAPAPPGFHRLEVRGVGFTYPSGNAPALRSLSMEVGRGEVVALVGENGSGKTTLAKLLAGLYRPQTGSIRWDGVDIGSVDPDDLRRSIAVIFQDFIRYQLPARDNVALGRPEAAGDFEAIREAARQADADRFLEALPHGYETMLGPEFFGGTDLSVGQWQRVALARAFFRDASFVILDEPTAALDPRAEHDLFQRIRTLLADRTVLLISHRFSSVRSADRIYVLAEGQVVEAGTHEELMDHAGLYAELFTLQAAAYLRSPGDGQSAPEEAGRPNSDLATMPGEATGIDRPHSRCDDVSES